MNGFGGRGTEKYEKGGKAWKLSKVNLEGFSRPRVIKSGAAKRAISRMFMLFTDFASTLVIFASQSRQRPSMEDSRTCLKRKSRSCADTSDSILLGVCSPVLNHLLLYGRADALIESRKIHLIRQYEKFIAAKGESLAQTHQRFNCLPIDLKTYDVVYSNSQVISKFMEALPEYWENYTM
ncbi:hypothetical protein OSB04_019277 [Centaurea solstitialis]|uniref:Uncharacterized protein n=1 Tax=Centaurea solstitialis TaxID=347529 RepID=A0AA38SQ07_9ASTR|nr:hypothetical protein OSB04_019277 [Centaurea solstitialis]